MAKNPKSNFQLFRKSTEVLAMLLDAVSDMLKGHADEEALSMAIMETGLKVSDACDRKILTEFRLRRELQDIREKELGELTPVEVQEMFEKHAKQRGLRSVRVGRDHLLELLGTPGWENLSPQEIADIALPQVLERNTHVLGSKLNKTLDRMQVDVDEGSRILHEALASSELTGDGHDGDPGTPDDHHLSDEET